MARVVSHAMKQASLDLKDMVEKKSIGLEMNDITEFAGSFRMWDSDDVKPEIIETTIEQIRALFNIGSEVKGWRVTHYPPTLTVDRKFINPSLVIKPNKGAMGGRFIIVVGSREVANMGVSMGRTEAETPTLMMDGDCLYIKITLCPVLEVTFNNLNGEKLAARKGFRETIIRKNPYNRHVLVFDGLIEMSEVIEKVKRDFGGSLLNGEKITTIDEAMEKVIQAAS